MSHAAWPEETTRALLLSEFDERYRRYRLSIPEADRAMVGSLKRYGPMAPVVVCLYDGAFVLIGTSEKKAFVLEKPRLALEQAAGLVARSWDPRLSPGGNRIHKQLGHLLEQLSRLENWLSHRGRSELAACDAAILRPSFENVIRQSTQAAALSVDFLRACFPDWETKAPSREKSA